MLWETSERSIIWKMSNCRMLQLPACFQQLYAVPHADDLHCAARQNQSVKSKTVFKYYNLLAVPDSALRRVQTLHIVRHGESTYNAASRTGSGFSDPQIFDPVLTENGRRQVHVLRALCGLAAGARHVLLITWRAVARSVC